MKKYNKASILAVAGVTAALALVMKQFAMQPQETHMIAKPAINEYKRATAASGIVEALHEDIAVGVLIPGVVKELYVKVGEAVKEGTPLLLIDDDQTRAQLEVDQKQLLMKIATLKKLTREFQRAEGLVESGAVSYEEYETRLYDYETALRDAQMAQATYKQTLTTLQKMTVNSPKEGVVLKVDLRKGEYALNMPMEEDSSIVPAIIVGSKELQARVDVDEENAHMIRPGQKAVAYTRGLDKRPLSLEFMRIEPYVVPKVSLTGASNERVDTRVLRVIYKVIVPEGYVVYPGQQLDVFIDEA